MQTYSHSGRIPMGGVILTVLIGLATAIIGGFLYAYLFPWASLWLFRWLLAFGFALNLGYSVAVGTRRGKIRSPLFVTIAALATTLAAFWVYWGAIQWARDGVGVGWFAWTPAGLIAYGEHLFANGSWSLRGWVVKGWPLVGFWIAEVCYVLYVSLPIARSDVRRPFCESCCEWTNSTKGLMQLSADGSEPAWQEVLAGELPALADFEPASPYAVQYVRLDLASCPQCEHSNFLTIVTVSQSVDRKGKTTTTEAPLMTNGVVSDAHAEFLRQFAQQAAANSEFDDDEDDLQADDSADEEKDA